MTIPRTIVEELAQRRESVKISSLVRVCVCVCVRRGGARRRIAAKYGAFRLFPMWNIDIDRNRDKSNRDKSIYFVSMRYVTLYAAKRDNPGIFRV